MSLYLYIDQLASKTPWTKAGIRTMIARGVFKLGVHYFKPKGPHSRPVFKWDAVVRFIEESARATTPDAVHLANGTVVRIDPVVPR